MSLRIFWLIAVMFAVVTAHAAAVVNGPPPVQAFFSYPQISDVQISPDGKYLAMVVADDNTGEDRKLLEIIGTDDRKPKAGFKVAGEQQIRSFWWANDTRVYIKSADNDRAPTIEIQHVEVGVHLFVFVVPPGSYCVTRYSYGNYYITQNDPKHGVCFYVIAGKIAYSGNLAPRGYNGKVYVDQNYESSAFQKMLKTQYPKLAIYPVVTA